MMHPPPDTSQVAGLPLEGKVLVLGLGPTGLSVVQHLLARGYEVAVTDTRARPPGLDELQARWPQLPLFLGGFDAGAFAAAGSLVVSPGVPLQEPLVAKAIAQGKPVLGDIELFAREVQAPVAAISGSNGKSTVTTLLAAMAEAGGRRVAVGGNLGEPALNLLALDADRQAELYILELSSFQLDTLASLRPAVAALLNISADHLDRYGSLEAYRASKGRIFRGAAQAVVNADDPEVMRLLPQGLAARAFSLAPGFRAGYGLVNDQASGICLARDGKALLPVSRMLIPGRHNWANALAAWAMAEALDIEDGAVIEALCSFTGLRHRTQLVAEREGVRWYNDSKGTNVGATIAALEGLAGEGAAGARVVLIAGGDCKGADFAELAPVVERTARAVVLIGRDAPILTRALDGRVRLLSARDLGQAVRLARQSALRGDAVLLSPACASFDMFTNYMHRGDAFIEAVAGLFAGQPAKAEVVA